MMWLLPISLTTLFTFPSVVWALVTLAFLEVQCTLWGSSVSAITQAFGYA